MFSLQVTPGGAIHADGENRLSLLLQHAISGATYTVEVTENPVIMSWYNRVAQLPSVAGPEEHTIHADGFQYVVFPNNPAVINRVQIKYSNGQDFDHNLSELLRERFESAPIIGYQKTVGTFDLNNSRAPIAVLAVDCALCLVDCRNITQIVLHTDGSVVPVTTFTVGSY